MTALLVAIFLVAWVVSGAAGSILTIEFFFLRGERPMDVRVRDLPLFAALALVGPLNFLVGLCFYIGWLSQRAINRSGFDLDAVVYKGKMRDE